MHVVHTHTRGGGVYCRHTHQLHVITIPVDSTLRIAGARAIPIIQTILYVYYYFWIYYIHGDFFKFYWVIFCFICRHNGSCADQHKNIEGNQI